MIKKLLRPLRRALRRRNPTFVKVYCPSCWEYYSAFEKHECQEDILKRYVFRDIQTGKRYEVYAFNALEAKGTVAKLMGIPFWNLKIVERPDQWDTKTTSNVSPVSRKSQRKAKHVLSFTLSALVAKRSIVAAKDYRL